MLLLGWVVCGILLWFGLFFGPFWLAHWLAEPLLVFPGAITLRSIEVETQDRESAMALVDEVRRHDSLYRDGSLEEANQLADAVFKLIPYVRSKERADALVEFALQVRAKRVIEVDGIAPPEPHWLRFMQDNRLMPDRFRRVESEFQLRQAVEMLRDWDRNVPILLKDSQRQTLRQNAGEMAQIATVASILSLLPLVLLIVYTWRIGYVLGLKNLSWHHVLIGQSDILVTAFVNDTVPLLLGSAALIYAIAYPSVAATGGLSWMKSWQFIGYAITFISLAVAPVAKRTWRLTLTFQEFNDLLVSRIIHKPRQEHVFIGFGDLALAILRDIHRRCPFRQRKVLSARGELLLLMKDCVALERRDSRFFELYRQPSGEQGGLIATGETEVIKGREYRMCIVGVLGDAQLAHNLERVGAPNAKHIISSVTDDRSSFGVLDKVQSRPK